MPTGIFKPMAEGLGFELKVKAITKGGYRLSQFADPENEYGKKVEAELSGEKGYDFVILQEQSLAPAFAKADSFYGAVRNLVTRIRAIGAEPILYSTWGRKSDHSALEQYGWTNESMTWKLAAAYQAIGDELSVRVAHVGLAFFDIYNGESGIEVYHTDSTHPSHAGSYLAAATLLSKIFDTDPTAADFTGLLPKETATALLEAAKRAVMNTPEIPDEYKTSSVGVHRS